MLQLTWYRVTVRYILNSDVKIAIRMSTLMWVWSLFLLIFILTKYICLLGFMLLNLSTTPYRDCSYIYPVHSNPIILTVVKRKLANCWVWNLEVLTFYSYLG